ncbi:hypothetical protein TrVE_jg7902 [Triparma verrucosa]|uniref:phosphoglycerate mutase (2,3-diphosphoglycerate-dependent) n=1 Tax=Triparma verrucosa TaxID=1606542 RepID=A0A9W7C4W0_9STRA|nr:hypothetical protein TrVE_jg7902 [Triparma verrucosa]
MRHGESEFNTANIFTGWCDVALTPRGVVEATEAGQVFLSCGVRFKVCYTSVLSRSISTAFRSLESAGVGWVDMVKDWRLNERHYGALQGLSKERTGERLGREKVMKWRRSFFARPPEMEPGHPHYDMIENDLRYRKLKADGGITKGESLEDTQKRVVAVWEDTIVKESCTGGEEGEEGDCVLVVAHANTLRALLMHLDSIEVSAIEDVNIPTAVPFYYDIDNKTGKVVDNKKPAGSFRGKFIYDDLKKRSFLERRRAAQDPWLWALRDDDVEEGMLNKKSLNEISIEEEASRNTKLFASNPSPAAKKV